MITATEQQLPFWRNKENRKYGFHGKPILIWELDFETIQFDYDITDEFEMFQIWLNRIYESDRYSNGMIPIEWYTCTPTHKKVERCPWSFKHYGNGSEDWLTYFEQLDVPTVNWFECEVVDKKWKGDKHSSFITAATGWKPAALQPFVYLPSLIEGSKVQFYG